MSLALKITDDLKNIHNQTVNPKILSEFSKQYGNNPELELKPQETNWEGSKLGIYRNGIKYGHLSYQLFFRHAPHYVVVIEAEGKTKKIGVRGGDAKLTELVYLIKDEAFGELVSLAQTGRMASSIPSKYLK